MTTTEQPATHQGTTITDLMAAADRVRANGDWFPANGGTEEVFTSRGGHRLLYCWQPSSGRHAYLNVDTDTIMTDEEAQRSLGTY